MSKSKPNQNRERNSASTAPNSSSEPILKSSKKKLNHNSVDIEKLAEDYIKKYRAGKSPSIEQYIKKFPGLAEEIQECFPAIAALEGLKAFNSSEGKISLGRSQPKQLGDFRIVREIGRGGMGIVYEAIQESLNRPVALKVLPRHSLLEPKQLKRFKKEAKIAASLHHTNIVPVFGVGENDGFHYYVMQLNNGAGLDELLQRMSATEPQSEIQINSSANTVTQNLDKDTGTLNHSDTDSDLSVANNRSQEFPWQKFTGRISTPQAVAKIGIQAAKALQYAHDRGILHRDIKPGNLLIDHDGILRVTDFGLARAIDPDNMSMTEEIVGTLGYMAPELFVGETILEGDIYSLGITLYELLTRQVAFERSERSHIIDRIRSGSIKKPRSLNSAIPKDLETIILKAIAVNPKYRYGSAEELGKDLKYFLEDRPIRARRVTVAERIVRWSRRNPVVAGLSGLAVALLFTIGVVTSLGYRAELIQRKRAEETVELATESLDRLFNRFVPGRSQSSMQLIADDISTDDTSSQLILSKESASLLTEMIGFYEELAKQTGEKDDFQLKTAVAQKKVGDIHQRLGDYKASLDSYQKSLTSYQNLLASQSDDHDLLINKAVIQNEMGLLFRKTGESDKGGQFHLNALESLSHVSSGTNGDPELQFEIARTYFLMVQKLRPELREEPDEIFSGRNDFSRFRGHGPPGHRPRHPRRPGKDGPQPRDDRPPRKGGGPRDGRPNGERTPRREKWSENDDQFQDEQRGPGQRKSGQRNYRQRNHDQVPKKKHKRSKEHQKYLEKAIAILEDLTKKDARNTEYQYLLALCLQEQIPDTFNKTPEGDKTEQRVVEILENLVENHPQVADYRYALVSTYEKVDVRNEPEESMTKDLVEQLNKAINHARRLVSDHPTIPVYKITLIHAHNKLATVLEHMMWDEPDSTAFEYLNSAEQSRRAALRLQKELVVQFPDSETHQNWLSKFNLSLASVIKERGNYEEAIKYLNTAISQLKPKLKNSSSNQRVSHELYNANSLLAEIYREMEEHDKSREYRDIADEYRHQGRPPHRKPEHDSPEEKK